MAIPIVYFLYAFYAFLAIWALFGLVAVAHLMKYGFKTFFTYAVALVYMAVSFLLLAVILNFMGQFDWTAEISVLEGLFLTGNQFISL